MDGLIYFTFLLSIQVALVSCTQFNGNNESNPYDYQDDSSVFFENETYIEDFCQETNPLFSYFLTNSPGPYCGRGLLTDTVGAFDVWNRPLENNSCKWVICSEKGLSIQIKFTWTNQRKNHDCEMEYFETCDGCHYSEEGELLNGTPNRICWLGESLSHRIVSTKRHITLKYWRPGVSNSNRHYSFLASYHMFANNESECGGTYFGEGGIISSPVFHPPPGKVSLCLWDIMVAIGHRIEFSFLEFEIQNDRGRKCVKQLEMIDGVSETYPRIKAFSRDRPPPANITSNSSRVHLKYYFSRWCKEQRIDLRLRWSARKQETGCNETLNLPGGTITSPNFPNKQLPDLICWWKITVNEGNLIRLTFVHFVSEVYYDFYPIHKCPMSYLKVVENENKTQTPLGIWCEADDSPGVIEPHTKSAIVMMKSVPKYFENIAFQLKFETVCTYTLKGLEGIIESINYPDMYPPNLKCIWTIESGNNSKVVVNVTQLDLELSRWYEYLDDDYIEIASNENEEWVTLRKFKQSGHPYALPHAVTAYGKTVQIRFQSYHHVQRVGCVFRLQWRIEGCEKEMIGTEGAFQSPKYPNEYPRNIHCKWRIATDDNMKVVVTIHNWDTENSTDCRFDGIKIYSGPDDSSYLLANLCGRGQFPVVFTSDFNKMLVEFYSDESHVATGFNASFQGIAADNVNPCGGLFASPTGYIYSPNYPNNYRNNMECTWLINVHQNYKVALTFLDIDIYWGSEGYCESDDIRVTYIESALEFIQIGRYCGQKSDVPEAIVSPGNSFVVRFKTDGVGVGRGFKAKYFQTCGATLSHKSGVITSPEFMAIETGAGNCSWTIETKDNTSRVVLIFTKFYWPVPDQFCLVRNVQVFDGRTSGHFNASRLYIGCCNHLPPPLISSGNSMTLQTTNGEALQFEAIYLTVPAECISMLLDVSDGSSDREGYLEEDTQNSTKSLCSSLVKTEQGQISILVQSFLKDSHGSYCDSSFVEVIDSSVSGMLVGHFCRQEIPILTTESQHWIVRLDLEEQGNSSFFQHNTDISGNFEFDINVTTTIGHPYYFQGLENFAKYILVLICLLLVIWIIYRCIR